MKKIIPALAAAALALSLAGAVRAADSYATFADPGVRPDREASRG